MLLFFRLFDTGIPWPVAVCTIVVAFALTCLVVWRCKQNMLQRILLIWIVACLFLMLYSTVRGREPHDDFAIQLIPFDSIRVIRDGYIERLYEKIYNVLFFIPLGCLYALYFRRKVILRSFAAGIATSIGIELLQLITRTGTCETDDVICNAVGCLIGAYAVAAVYKVRQTLGCKDKGPQPKIL